MAEKGFVQNAGIISYVMGRDKIPVRFWEFGCVYEGGQQSLGCVVKNKGQVEWIFMINHEHLNIPPQIVGPHHQVLEGNIKIED